MLKILFASGIQAWKWKCPRLFSHVTRYSIFSNSSIILLGLRASIGVTRSYSSRPFLCALVYCHSCTHLYSSVCLISVGWCIYAYFISKCHEANIHCINGEWTLWPSQFSNWLDRLYHKVNDVPENKKKFPPDFSISWLFCKWDMENRK